MIVTESQARAIIKKEIKIWHRRFDNDTSPVRKSRKAYMRDSLQSMFNSSFVVFHDMIDKNISNSLILGSCNEHNEMLDLIVIQINSKKFTLNSKFTGIVFSPHVIWRMMQWMRTDKLEPLKPFFSEIAKSLLHHTQDIYCIRLFIKHMGKFVVQLIENELVVKTFISKDTLTGDDLVCYNKCQEDTIVMKGEKFETSRETDWYDPGEENKPEILVNRRL